MLLLAVLLLLLLVQIYIARGALVLTQQDRGDLLLALLQVSAALSERVTCRSHVLEVGVDVGHRISVVGVQDGLLQFLLDECEEHVDDRESTSYEVAFPLEMVVWELEGLFHQAVHVGVLNCVALDVTECLVDHRAGDRLHL